MSACFFVERGFSVTWPNKSHEKKHESLTVTKTDVSTGVEPRGGCRWATQNVPNLWGIHMSKLAGFPRILTNRYQKWPRFEAGVPSPFIWKALHFWVSSRSFSRNKARAFVAGQWREGWGGEIKQGCWGWSIGEKICCFSERGDEEDVWSNIWITGFRKNKVDLVPCEFGGFDNDLNFNVVSW